MELPEWWRSLSVKTLTGVLTSNSRTCGTPNRVVRRTGPKSGAHLEVGHFTRTTPAPRGVLESP